ncbi:MAG: glycosyltransferase family 2 protein [Roseburia sp.]
MKKLVIIPAYNEEGGIVKTVTDVVENAKDFDYVVINDCSKDNTLKICREHSFNVVNLPVNMGIGGGVQTGYMYAYRNGYDIAVQFDGDGQHNASYLDGNVRKTCQRTIGYGNWFKIYRKRRISILWNASAWVSGILLD